jgi:uncharacterized membrane protein
MRASPFDLSTILLAKHPQHVVLIHFPVAPFITAVAFDDLAQWTNRVRGSHGASGRVSQWRELSEEDHDACKTRP